MFSRFFRSLPMLFWQFFLFALICAFIGPLSFLLGQLLPRRSFNYKAFPYAPFKWEDNGRVYTKLKIQFWKDKVPDMSQYIKGTFRKRLGEFRSGDYLEELVLEMCVAEFVHFLLILASPVFLLFMEGVWGAIAMTAYALGNLPFIIIQRYNRPRLVMLMERQRRRKDKPAEDAIPQVDADQVTV